MKKSEAKKLVGKKWGELSRAGKNSIIAAWKVEKIIKK